MRYRLIALLLGILTSLALVWAVGESPFHVLKVLFEGAVGSKTSLGYSLYYTTTLIFTALSVSWALNAGLFNIGAEGQMAMGGVALLWITTKFANLPFGVVFPLGILAAFTVGGAWGALAGWMKAFDKCHEVLATILLNFVAYGFLGVVSSRWLKDPQSQSPETILIPENLRLSPLEFIGGSSPLNMSLVVALLIVVICYFVLRKNRYGIRTRMVGESPGLARYSGVRIESKMIQAMFISGGIAGLASLNDILGYSHRLKEGFTGGAGFMGVAVALLGKGNPWGLLAGALLFGVLQKGALDLDFETDKISQDFTIVIQALIIIFVASEKGIRNFFEKIKLRRVQNG